MRLNLVVVLSEFAVRLVTNLYSSAISVQVVDALCNVVSASPAKAAAAVVLQVKFLYSLLTVSLIYSFSCHLIGQ